MNSKSTNTKITRQLRHGIDEEPAKEGPVSSTKPHDVAGQQGRSYRKKNLV
jgi:hypothetical protein